MSSITTTATEKYIHISPYFIIYLNAFISIFGLFGNLLNIIVFINLRSFRRNPCVFYLMIDAIVNIGFSITANSNSFIWCKIKTMLINSFSLISMLITCFAALDQFFATSPHYYLRRRSTLKLSYRLTILSIFCGILFGIPIILYCDIYSTVGCIIRNSRFFFYYSYIHVPLLYGIFHSCISSLFGFLAFRNVRCIIRQRIQIVRRRLDRQLTAMVLIRIIFSIILSLPYVIYCTYYLNVIDFIENSVQVISIQIIGIICSSLAVINASASFYIFLIFCTRYRHQVKFVLTKKLWKPLRKKICLRHNQIKPAIEPSMNDCTTESKF
ncbi:unnamed protein product [Adineta steineri]|uniref:G-protein coupled receptors family 1 profile domain-containing protein n=1 Tax=Adineta steineri TaxID=433720 RepID=A0A818KIR6_9BILA|nr:unnamed protein product [Adineta steineri]CAF3558319.1 unnamed protein product [Adineta steineri]